MYEILKRMEQSEEVRSDFRMTFEAFLAAILKAMNLPNTKKHAGLIFNIFDNDKSGAIHAYNIANVSRNLGNELPLDEIHGIMNRCSQNRKAITLSNFMTVISKPRRTADVTPKASQNSRNKSSFDRRNASIATTEPTERPYVLQTAQTNKTNRLTPDIDGESMLKPDVSFNILDTGRN